jgi:MarR family transcriptional regulator, organic hydroperoxide resistance regulator
MSSETPVSREQRDRLLEALRAHGIVFTELGRGFGARMGLHNTDAAALVEILEAQDGGNPLTQKELGKRIGLTPGATSTLLTRLEDVGHIVRTRSGVDKRIVTLRASDGVERSIDGYFDPLTERLGSVMQRFSPEVLAEVERFLGEVSATMNDYVATAPSAPEG